MFGLIFNAAVLVLAAFVIYTLGSGFRAATGTVWERLLAAAQGSATILWARFSMLVGALATVLVEAADWLNAPGVADGIKAVMQPSYVAFFIIAMAVMSELARRRTLNPE